METASALGVGCYSAAEAAKLLQLDPRKTRRWLAGYPYKADGEARTAPAMWPLQYEAQNGQLLLGFRDLMQLRAVANLIEDRGVSPQAMRKLLAAAMRVLHTEHPLIQRQFKSDGHKLYLRLVKSVEAEDGLTDQERVRLLDLGSSQYVFETAVEPSFLGIEWDGENIGAWYPLGERHSVVVDPRRRFGTPIGRKSGVPSHALYAYHRRGHSIEETAAMFEVDRKEVEDAIVLGPRLVVH